MENITCELNGIKYLLVELCITEDNEYETKRVCNKYECIRQGVKKLERDGFFTDGYAIVAMLVPEKNVIAFNKERLK